MSEVRTLSINDSSVLCGPRHEARPLYCHAIWCRTDSHLSSFSRAPGKMIILFSDRAVSLKYRRGLSVPEGETKGCSFSRHTNLLNGFQRFDHPSQVGRDPVTNRNLSLRLHLVAKSLRKIFGDLSQGSSPTDPVPPSRGRGTSCPRTK